MIDSDQLSSTLIDSETIFSEDLGLVIESRPATFSFFSSSFVLLVLNLRVHEAAMFGPVPSMVRYLV